MPDGIQEIESRSRVLRNRTKDGESGDNGKTSWKDGRIEKQKKFAESDRVKNGFEFRKSVFPKESTRRAKKASECDRPSSFFFSQLLSPLSRPIKE